jgi:2-dehydro-3-deoxyphosphogluconate aldolase/(4S)-4-hydroxy-2-oxoglutarate aldolase
LLPAYLALPPVLAVGGSWFVTKELIHSNDFARITQLTAQAVKIAKEARP